VTRPNPRNLPASIRQRLLSLSKERGEDYGLVLTRYAVERLLYRLSRSKEGKLFVLKGAMLFATWSGRPHRPTRDLDLLGYGEDSVARLAALFRKVCLTEVEPDGMQFDADTIQVTEIREDQEYQGKRVEFWAGLAGAKIKLQIDIGFGDVVTPEAKEIDYPTLLDLPSPQLRAYTRETVVAEKLHAMVALGIVNSRMKDFYDLLVMAREFAFDGGMLARAIAATFGRRRTRIPSEVPIALSEEFARDPDKVTQWNAFLRRSRLEVPVPDLGDVLKILGGFAMPALRAAAEGNVFDRTWDAGGPWL